MGGGSAGTQFLEQEYSTGGGGWEMGVLLRWGTLSARPGEGRSREVVKFLRLRQCQAGECWTRFSGTLLVVLHEKLNFGRDFLVVKSVKIHSKNLNGSLRQRDWVSTVQGW